MNVEVIREQMKKLTLTTASKELDEVLSGQKKSVSLSWVSELLGREIDARKTKAIENRIKNAAFPERRYLEQFNWDFNPEIPREKIEALSTLEFVDKNQIVLFLGKPGTGKTHIAIALGIEAARRGHRVYCTSIKRLSQRITYAISQNKLDQVFKQMLSTRLWILDDWGVVSMKREVSEEVFDLLDRRKQSSAMILTSNRDVEEWNQVFHEPVLANAAIDRMFENADISIFEGESYRLKGRIKIPDLDAGQKKV